MLDDRSGKTDTELRRNQLKYRLKRGDTLDKVAKKHDVSYSDLVRANRKLRTLKTGVTVNIPGRRAGRARKKRAATYEQPVAEYPFLPQRPLNLREPYMPQRTAGRARVREATPRMTPTEARAAGVRENLPTDWELKHTARLRQQQARAGRTGMVSRRGGGAGQTTEHGLYRYTAEYGITPRIEEHLKNVQDALDRGDLPAFIPAWVIEEMGLDKAFLINELKYTEGVTGNLIRPQVQYNPPAPRSSGGGGGGYVRHGGGGGGGGAGSSKQYGIIRNPSSRGYTPDLGWLGTLVWRIS